MGEMTIAELSRAVGRLEENLGKKVDVNLHDRDITELHRGVDEIKDSQKWLLRLMVAQLLGLLVAIIIVVLSDGSAFLP